MGSSSSGGVISCKLADLASFHLAMAWAWYKLRALMVGSLSFSYMCEHTKMGPLYLMGLDVKDLGPLGLPEGFLQMREPAGGGFLKLVVWIR